MRITNARKDESGQWIFDMNLTESETSFLVELSVTSLLKVGMISIEEKVEDQEIDLTTMQQNAPSTGVVQ